MSGRLYISKAPCKRTRHCWMLHVASVCTPCCMLLGVVAQSLKLVKRWAAWKRKKNASSFSKFFLRFFVCCISCHIGQINTKREDFSRCALSDFEGLVLILHDLYRIPQRTRMTLSNNCAAALFFCDFSIFQEEPLKDFGYNWFLLNRFVFMGLSCSLDLTILENFRNKKQVWSYLWKRNQPSLTLKWIRSV